MYLASNQSTPNNKHLDIDLHSLREHVAIRQVCVLHVSSTHQFENIFTKEYLYNYF